MKQRRNQFDAIFTARDMVEKDAQADLNRIEQIAMERKVRYQRAYQDRVAKEKQINDLRILNTTQLLRAGDTRLIKSADQYLKRLKHELQLIEKKERELEAEMMRANVRNQQAEQELLNARIEKKQVERLIDNKLQQNRIIQEAHDEIAQDQLSTDSVKK